MRFYVSGSPPQNRPDIGFWLQPDNWDDNFQFQTTFVLRYVSKSTFTTIGFVKIGRQGLLGGNRLHPQTRAPSLPVEFDELGDDFFSLGQGSDYYEELRGLGNDVNARVLAALKDCAADLSRFERFYNEPSMQASLLRSVAPSTVVERLNPLTKDKLEQSAFHFSHSILFPDASGRLVLQFAATPKSSPPTNLHVLIGRNGVGKTTWLRSLAETIIAKQVDLPQWYATANPQGNATFGDTFYGLVLVSFSAFDAFRELQRPPNSFAVHMVSLRSNDLLEDTPDLPLPDRLAVQFGRSLNRCRVSPKRERWNRLMSQLASDDLFVDSGICELLTEQDELVAERDVENDAREVFARLSSGHAAVVLTLTRLVECVEEKTLVLIDEPEAHLHPPLLSSYVRALSDLLTERNGVAIIATHSPVVLQEVPSSCVWKIRRSGSRIDGSRPEIQTFGENLSLLTKEAFGLEVTKSGFFRLISTLVDQGMTTEEIAATFNHELGFEGLAIAQSLVAKRDIPI